MNTSPFPGMEITQIRLDPRSDPIPPFPSMSSPHDHDHHHDHHSDCTIRTNAHLKQFLASKECEQLIAFVDRLNQAVKNQKTTQEVHISQVLKISRDDTS